MNASAIRIEVFAGRIRRDEASLTVNPRERALLSLLIAAGRRALSRAELQDALWPDAEPDAARNALGVSVHRLRKALGDPGAVERSFAGYALGASVCPDVWDAEVLEGRLRRGPVLLHAELVRAHRLLTSLFAGPRVAVGVPVEALEAFCARAEAVRRSIALLLAEDALRRRDAEDALRCAEAVLGLDPCDEAACEVAMRAHLLLDDRGSAIREYRTYRRIVASELDLQPSPHLLAMLA